jgi:hypothetical protein
MVYLIHVGYEDVQVQAVFIAKDKTISVQKAGLLVLHGHLHSFPRFGFLGGLVSNRSRLFMFYMIKIGYHIFE